jgi:hypothetical protein
MTDTSDSKRSFFVSYKADLAWVEWKLEEARKVVNAAFEVFMQAGQEQYRAYFEDCLREIDGQLAGGLRRDAGGLVRKILCLLRGRSAIK